MQMQRIYNWRERERLQGGSWGVEANYYRIERNQWPAEIGVIFDRHSSCSNQDRESGDDVARVVMRCWWRWWREGGEEVLVTVRKRGWWGSVGDSDESVVGRCPWQWWCQVLTLWTIWIDDERLALVDASLSVFFAVRFDSCKVSIMYLRKTSLSSQFPVWLWCSCRYSCVLSLHLCFCPYSLDFVKKRQWCVFQNRCVFF